MTLLGSYLEQDNIVHGQENRQDMVLIIFIYLLITLQKKLVIKLPGQKK